jgi:hypothetical protein
VREVPHTALRRCSQLSQRCHKDRPGMEVQPDAFEPDTCAPDPSAGPVLPRFLLS